MHLTSRSVAFLGIASLSLLFLGGLGVLVVRTPSREPIQILLPTPSTASPPELKVYVSGAVQTPGVYLFAPGDRVEDALRAAGGASEEADLDHLNLAAKLRDADHVFVPHRGESVPPGKAGAPRVNINTATRAALDALPGIGVTRAQRIIDSRAGDGPFGDTWELVERKLLPPSVYNQIKDAISVN